MSKVYYLIGTEHSPQGLLRREPFRSTERYDPLADDWLDAPEMGRYIVLGDTMLEDLDENKVDTIKHRMRVRIGAD